MESGKRASFTSKFGFVMAAASSAIGLGNLWRFPYLAAQYGGGTFLAVYILLATTFGYALMITEIAIGRKTGLSPMKAFSSLDKRFGFCGALGAVVPIIITPYYGVIGGWVVKYVAVYLTGQGAAAAGDGFFGGFITSAWEPLFYFLLFDLFSGVVVFLGVEKGVERASKAMMPILLLLTVFVAIFAATRPGAWDGVVYYFKPDFSKVTGKAVLAALGQLFYSLSLAMGVMITYGSYMKKSDDMNGSVCQIEFYDTLVAVLAGLMIIPSVYVFSGGSESAMSAGPGLMFITLPKVFNAMTMGTLVGGAFFFLTFFAAITSHISLTETIVSNLMDCFRWSRAKASAVVVAFVMLMGVPSSLGFGLWSRCAPLGMDLLTFFDFVSNSVLMPILGFATCAFVGYVLTPQAVIEEIEAGGRPYAHKKFYAFLVKYVAPIGIVAILISSVASGLGFLSF